MLATLALTASLAACSGPPAAVIPTATPAPSATPKPTATRAPTAVPTPAPSATPRPAASSTAGEPAQEAAQTITDALRRTAAIETYSAAVSLSGSGFAGAAPGQTTNLLTLSARFDGAEHAFTAQGFLAAFLGADPTAGLEAVRADGESYLKGPLTLIGAVDPVWYRLPPERAALAEPPVSPATLRRVLEQTDLDGASFTAGAPLRREGLGCTPYTGGTAGSVALLRGLYAGGLPPLVAPDQIEAGETTLLICEDGNLHELTIDLAGAFPGSTPAPFSLELTAQLGDFGGDISISAPQGARELLVRPSPTP